MADMQTRLLRIFSLCISLLTNEVRKFPLVFSLACRPEDFPRVFLINAPLQAGSMRSFVETSRIRLQVFLYLLVACWGQKLGTPQ